LWATATDHPTTDQLYAVSLGEQHPRCRRAGRSWRRWVGATAVLSHGTVSLPGNGDNSARHVAPSRPGRHLQQLPAYARHAVAVTHGLKRVALGYTLGLSQRFQQGGQVQVRDQATEERAVLPEDRGIAFVGLDVHRSAPHAHGRHG